MVTAAGNSIPEIAIQNVTKRYRNAAVALQDISLTVERGEFVTFLGPSGCANPRSSSSSPASDPSAKATCRSTA